jgi:hypothetical protein
MRMLIGQQSFASGEGNLAKTPGKHAYFVFIEAGAGRVSATVRITPP